MQMMLMMVTNQISSADKPTNLKDSATKPINLKDSAASDSQWRDYEKKHITAMSYMLMGPMSAQTVEPSKLSGAWLLAALYFASRLNFEHATTPVAFDELECAGHARGIETPAMARRPGASPAFEVLRNPLGRVRALPTKSRKAFKPDKEGDRTQNLHSVGNPFKPRSLLAILADGSIRLPKNPIRHSQQRTFQHIRREQLMARGCQPSFATV